MRSRPPLSNTGKPSLELFALILVPGLLIFPGQSERVSFVAGLPFDTAMTPRSILIFTLAVEIRKIDFCMRTHAAPESYPYTVLRANRFLLCEIRQSLSEETSVN